MNRARRRRGDLAQRGQAELAIQIVEKASAPVHARDGLELAARAWTGEVDDYDDAFEKFIETTHPSTADRARVQYVFKQYDLLRPVPDLRGLFVWWYGGYEDFPQSEVRYKLFRAQGLEEYWRAEGFPPQCQLLVDESSRCD